MTIAEILLAIIAVLSFLNLFAIRKLKNDLINAIVVFAQSYDQTQNSRWETTESHRQALLDVANAVDSMEDSIGRIESNTQASHADNRS